MVLGNAIPDCAALAEKLDAPVCSNYQHNDSFPGSHPLAVGPLGYNGSKAAMELIAKADVVLALGTRLNPFSTLPGYGIDYWPKTAKLIQVDINPDRIGLTKPVAVGICGDAKLVAQSLLKQLSPTAGNAGREERKALVHQTKSGWLQALSSMDHEDDDPGTTWKPRRASATPTACRRARPGARSRRACRRTRSSPPTSATIARSATPIRPSSRDGSTSRPVCSVPAATASRRSSAPRSAVPTSRRRLRRRRRLWHLDERDELDRPQEWPGITMVVFRNYQWGAEKRNSILWFDDNFVGTELDPHLSYAKVAEGCGLKGVTVKTQAELTEALSASCEAQKKRVTTFIEVILNQELGEPFRRDAMKKPTVVAGIRREDMRPQQVA